MKQIQLKSIGIYCLSLFFLALLWSCGKNEFKVKGEIYGAEKETLVLEKAGFQGDWIKLDSVHINKNGGYSISFPAPASPEIFRLVLNNRYIYFPVDSTETITIDSSIDKFGSDFTLAGSSNAEKMGKFEKSLQAANLSDQDSIEIFKRNVYTNYIKDSAGSILAYYILTKTIDGKALYNPSEPQDRKYFAAVATGFKSKRPDDPHTKLLEQTAMEAMKNKFKEQGKVRQIEAEELSLIEIELPDETGNIVKLSETVGKGKPVVVIFSLLNHPDSPDLNMALADLYKNKNGKVEFYNVSLDADQYDWREAAKNLPWITVYSPGGNLSEDAARYNVNVIPTFFIYNENGDLTERAMTIDELKKGI